MSLTPLPLPPHQESAFLGHIFCLTGYINQNGPLPAELKFRENTGSCAPSNRGKSPSPALSDSLEASKQVFNRNYDLKLTQCSVGI